MLVCTWAQGIQAESVGEGSIGDETGGPSTGTPPQPGSQQRCTDGLHPPRRPGACLPAGGAKSSSTISLGALAFAKAFSTLCGMVLVCGDSAWFDTFTLGTGLPFCPPLYISSSAFK